MDKIVISGVRAIGYHGVLQSERDAGQSFIVDCEMFLNLKSASTSDDLKKTIDYGEVSLLIKEIVEGKAVNLIETLAGSIADAILKRYRKIQKVVVTVHKPEAPIQVEFLDVAVVIERKR